MDIRVCDVVFFKATDNFISKAVAKVTASPFTHVGIVVSEITKDGNRVIIVEADRFIKTRRREFEYDPALHTLYRVPSLSATHKRLILQFVQSQVGKSYDYLQIVGMLLRLTFNLHMGTLFNRANYLICSELIDIAFYTAGVERDTKEYLGDITPYELLQYYDFELVD